MTAPVDRCWECEEPFTGDEWELRHSDADTGEDVHAECCRDCPVASVTGGIIHITLQAQA